MSSQSFKDQISAWALALRVSLAHWQALSDVGLGEFAVSLGAEPYSEIEARGFGMFVAQCLKCLRSVAQAVNSIDVVGVVGEHTDLPYPLFYRQLVRLAQNHCSHAFEIVEMRLTDRETRSTFTSAVSLALLCDTPR